MPLLTLGALLAAGALRFWPAMLAMATVAASGAGLALWGLRDLGRVPLALRAVVEATTSAPSPRWPPVRDVVQATQPLLRDCLDRARRMEALRRADQAILESLADPLLILGPNLEVRRVNRAAIREFGPEAAAILRHPSIRSCIDLTRATRVQQTATLTLPVPVPRELRATVSLLGPEAGGDRLVISLADRTREAAVERMRADFVANASHELRTPLSSLTGFIETLRGPAADDPAAQQRFLGIMAEQAGRMQRLIDELLSLSRIELVEHVRPADPVDLAGLAERIAAGFEPAIALQAATLEIAIEPGMPPCLGDADQLGQVLQNLLDNALKYGGTGVAIRLSATRAQPGEHWPARAGLVLAVADNGPGIPQEHLPRLTERFYRADKCRSRAAGGTGLGLAIVKHIINRHRGQLRIESTVGKGTTIRAWLPAG